LQPRLGQPELRSSLRGRLAAVRRDRAHRTDQPRHHQADRHERRAQIMAASRRRLSSIGRPSPWVYVFLAVILLGSIFPIYWSLLIGSGDSSTLNDPNKSWWPGGNFLSNA